MKSKCICCLKLRQMVDNMMCGHCFDNCLVQHLDESVIAEAKNIEKRQMIVYPANKVDQATQAYPPEGMTLQEVQKRIAEGIATETDWHYKRVLIAQENAQGSYDGDGSYFNKGFI